MSRIADTSVVRAQINYDNTSALVRLAGPGGVRSGKGFAVLVGLGDPLVYTDVFAGGTGISVLGVDYAITAGMPPHQLIVLHGGQNASRVTSRLTKMGFKQAGGLLIAPSAQAVPSDPQGPFGPIVPHAVRADGSEVTVGEPGTDLSQAGPTLASDPLISALAGCLGDVVAANIAVGGGLGGRHPVAVAIGVRTPASNTATPHAVACVAWPGQAGAAQYTADAQRALSHGLDPRLNEPYSAILPHPSVTSIGGDHHIVQWQADSPGNPGLVFEMVNTEDLPALPDCARLTAGLHDRVIGCP